MIHYSAFKTNLSHKVYMKKPDNSLPRSNKINKKYGQSTSIFLHQIDTYLYFTHHLYANLRCKEKEILYGRKVKSFWQKIFRERTNKEKKTKILESTLFQNQSPYVNISQHFFFQIPSIKKFKTN